MTKHTDIIPGQSHFIGVIQFSWIGGTYHVAFKFRHITPPDWSDQEWFGGEWRSPEDWYNIYGIVASGWEDWLVLSIDPSDGPSQTN